MKSLHILTKSGHMTSQYIPEKRDKDKQTMWERLKTCCFGSVYVGKVKITLDAVGGPMYKLGITFTPRYQQLEFNVGKLVLVFWYRDML